MIYDDLRWFTMIYIKMLNIIQKYYKQRYILISIIKIIGWFINNDTVTFWWITTTSVQIVDRAWSSKMHNFFLNKISLSFFFFCINWSELIAMKSLDVRNIVIFKHKNAKGPAKIFRDLNGALSLHTIKKWCKMIANHRAINLSKFPGRPRTVRTKVAIQKIKNRLNRKKKAHFFTEIG